MSIDELVGIAAVFVFWLITMAAMFKLGRSQETIDRHKLEYSNQFLRTELGALSGEIERLRKQVRARV